MLPLTTNAKSDTEREWSRADAGVGKKHEVRVSNAVVHGDCGVTQKLRAATVNVRRVEVGTYTDVVVVAVQ